jgi:hypothetical protein
VSHDIRYDINKPNIVRKITSTLNVLQYIFINSPFYKHVKMEIDINFSCINAQFFDLCDYIPMHLHLNSSLFYNNALGTGI